MLNPEHIKEVIELANRSGYFRLLSISIMELGVGYSVVEMRLEEKHLTPFDGIHGGAYSSLVDTAAYWALYGDLDENSGLISLDVHVDYLMNVKEGVLTARGKRIKFGKTICLAEVKVFDPANRIVASGTSKLMASKGLQTIEQARQFMGAKPLSPKFLPGESKTSDSDNA
jgi:uncharacterized protein (TIGR00369 family)